MQKRVIQKEEDSEDLSEEELREEIYDQFDISSKERLGIRYILPILDVVAQTEARYEIDTRSKILAEISLIQAYLSEPKFRLLGSAALIIGIYDFLHTLNPEIYAILLGAVATLNGFVSSLRSPAMIAAELDSVEDEDGMPANYRAKALTSVNTNITLFLFVVAVGVQLLVTGSFIQGEILAENVANGTLHPSISALVLAITPLLLALRRNDDVN